MTRHFLKDDDLSPAEQAEVLALAASIKATRHTAEAPMPLARSPGGRRPVRQAVDPHASVVLDRRRRARRLPAGHRRRKQPARPGEPVEDTTRVLDRQVAAIVWRTFGQDRIEAMASVSRVPVVNALTDEYHPCQILADLQTVIERRGQLAGLTLTYLEDGANNMAHSYLLGGATAGMHVRIGSPEAFQPDPAVVKRAAEIAARDRRLRPLDRRRGGRRRRRRRPGHRHLGVDGAGGRVRGAHRPFLPYAVDEAALGRAADDAVVLHCLPAYRGKEIAAAVIDQAAERGLGRG